MAERASSIFSNAFNFDGFLKGGVDPRTGLYTFSLSLGVIHSTATNGPSFDLKLQFNPLSRVDYGLGAGWSVPLTRYDVLQHTLMLSSGDSYKATPVNGVLKFSEPHVENFKLNSPADDHYSLIHKSGLREELEVFESSDYAVPKRIFSAIGASISLNYDAFQGVPRLIEVTDTERILLNISYEEAHVIFTRYPNTTSEARFSLSLANDRVVSIRLPTGDEWLFGYEEIGGLVCLSQINSAMGALELIEYVQHGHAFPPGAPWPRRPSLP